MSPHTTNALVVTRPGGSDVFEVQLIEIPEPGPGQLLVRVAAAGVNFIDVYQRQGIYPMPTPFVLCGEGAGTVEAVGPGVTTTSVGDRVAWSSASGSAAELALVAEAVTVRVPDSVSSKLAAAAMLQGMTAHYLVNSTYPVQAGDWVLVHAAAGGVGQLLIQLAKAKGATVVGTVSTPAKAAKATAVGADHIINYSEVTDVAGAVRKLTNGAGVAVVYDGVGKSTFDASLASLRRRGMLVLFGGASGQVPPFDIQRLNSGGSLFLTRPTIVHYIATREELLERGNSILGAIVDGTLHVEIGGEYPLTEAARAYDDLEARRTTGKLLLIP
jgi:NADPH2:quinone reductase